MSGLPLLEKQERLTGILRRMEEACSEAGRSPSSVRLIGVSKTKTWEEVRDFHSLGLKDFGENYVQEAMGKIEAVSAWAGGQPFPPAPPRWHFIGSLQSNKAKFLPGRFTLFHALDSLSLAEKLNRAAANAGVVQDCLVEVNVDEETTKGGIPAAELPSFLEGLNAFTGIRILGTMCIPAPSGKGTARKPFERMRLLQEEMNASSAYRRQLTELSMGMSGDFPEAILEGSTMVRVGTALFGERT